MSDRHLEAGHGTPLVHLVDAGALRLTPAHERLAQRFRVLVLEAAEPAALAQAIERLGLDAVNLLATGRASRAALGLALRLRERVLALALESPEAPGDDADALAGLVTPTLVLLGTRDDSGATAAGRACAQRIPGAHLVFVYDAGRTIGRDRPEAFAEVVADFLERHEAFVLSRTITVIHP